MKVRTTQRADLVLAVARSSTTVAEIADRPFLYEGTVRNYLSSAIAKARARNRTEVVRTAENNGWL